jgi:hypothetical protein
VSQEQAISEDVGLTWNDDESFDIDGANFRASIVDRFRSSRRRFLLVKPRAMVEPYGEVLASLEAEHILELGSCQGGGAALFALLCQPERLVAVDIKGGPDGRSRALSCGPEPPGTTSCGRSLPNIQCSARPRPR